jgi:predicted AlkP superfamily pyrophosphatase or phosphodiesterase
MVRTIVGVLFASLLLVPTAGQEDLRATVILVGLDGWRWDYYTKAPTPNLRSLMARGVRAENLIASFPSKTFPGFYTIATGLYPGHHGIVANNIKDPTTGRTLTLSKREEVGDAMWWGGEPIWVTSARAGQLTGAMFWPGTEAPIGGVRPWFWKVYDEEYPKNQRVDDVLGWFDRPASERPTLMTLYFDDPDTAGHDHGPDSREVREAIMRTDAYLGRLLRGLESRGISGRVNIVVVSDHGMAAVSERRVIVLDDYIDLDDVEIVDINPTLGIIPVPGKDDAIYRALASAHPRLKVYRREATPERWHYRSHPRIPPIVGVADEGWQVLRRATMLDILARKIAGDRGAHGYDPLAMSMRGLFVAAGPAFKEGVTVPALENVSIYNVLARILGVTPAANDGDPAVPQALLRPN